MIIIALLEDANLDYVRRKYLFFDGGDLHPGCGRKDFDGIEFAGLFVEGLGDAAVGALAEDVKELKDGLGVVGVGDEVLNVFHVFDVKF